MPEFGVKLKQYIIRIEYHVNLFLLKNNGNNKIFFHFDTKSKHFRSI